MARRGVLLSLGAVVVVAGGGALWFFLIHQPAKQLKDAQAEVTAWEARWQEARGCLLGDAPGSNKTSEALAIRQMAPEPGDFERCTPLMVKLSRGRRNGTGIDAVEAAWRSVDETAQVIAQKYPDHAQGMYKSPDDPLLPALDALDTARAKLRTAAKLAANDRGKPLAAGQIIPIHVGNAPVSSMIIDPPSAHGATADGFVGPQQHVEVWFTPGAAPKAALKETMGVRALPGSDWGAIGELLVVQPSRKTQTGAMTVGAMDAAGKIAAPQSLSVTLPVRPLETPPAGSPRLEPLKPGENWGSVIPFVATGTLADGTIVSRTEETLVIARAKANTLTSEPEIQIASATESRDLDGRAVVLWQTLEKANRALLLHHGGEERIDLPTSFERQPCMTADRVYALATEPQLMVFGGGKPLERLDIAPGNDLVGCTADAAILRNGAKPRELEICTTTCRKVTLPSDAPTDASVTAIGGKLVAVAAHATVVGVWIEGKPPAYYAVSERTYPYQPAMETPMAMTDGKVIDLLAQSYTRGSEIVILRVPVP